MSPEVLIPVCLGGIIAWGYWYWTKKPVPPDMILVHKANDLLTALDELKESWESKDAAQIERSLIRAELTASYLRRWLEIGK